MSRKSAATRSRSARTDPAGRLRRRLRRYLGDRVAADLHGSSMSAVTDVDLLRAPAEHVREGHAASGSRWPYTCWRALFFGKRNCQSRRPARAAARAGLAVRRADPRAEQPGGGRGAGHGRAARPGRRHAAQAGADRRRASSTAEVLRSLIELQEEAVEQVGEGPSRSAAGGLRPRGRAGRLARGSRLTGGWDLAAEFVAAGLDVDWLEGVAAAVDGASSSAPCAGSPTPSRPSC